MSKVTEFFSPFEKEPYPHEVAGRTFSFHEVPFRVLCKMRKAIVMLAQSLSVLLHNFDTEIGQHRSINEKTGLEEITVMPKAADLSRQHSIAKQESIARLVDAFVDKDNVDALCLLVLHSLRDDFQQPSSADAKEFADKVSVPDLVEFVTGMLKANQRMFAPFAKEAARVGERLKGRLIGAMAEPTIEEPNEPTDEEDSMASSTRSETLQSL